MSDSALPHPDPDEAAPNHLGYACGRLLAILTVVEAAVAGDTATLPVTESFAATASHPAEALGPILVRAVPSLTLALTDPQDAEASDILANHLDEVLIALGAELPRSLGPEGQAAFALGFLQEQMALRQFSPRPSPERQDVLVEEESIDPDDIFPDDL